MKIINNINILTMDENLNVYENSYIKIDGSIIKEIGRSEDLIVKENDEIFDAKGSIAIPGFINTHTHLAMTLFRNLGDDIKDRLKRVLFPLEEKVLSKEFVYHSTKYSLSESLLSGITTSVDMYYYEEEVKKAAKDMNIRAFLSQTIIDPNEKFNIEYTKNFIKGFKDDSLLKPIISLHSPYSVSEKGIKEAFKISKENNLMITMHLQEMDFEMKMYKDKYNKSPIEFLDSINCLSSDLLAAHCIYLSDNDISLLKKHNVRVSHCIAANTKSAKGIARVKELIENNILVSLATDGPSSSNVLDLFPIMRFFSYAQKTKNKDRSIFPARQILKMVTIDAAKSLKMEKEIGSLEVGKKADIVLIETDSVNMYPIHDYYSSLVYSANATNVSTVIVNGEFLVKDKKLVKEDLKQLRSNLDTFSLEFTKVAKDILKDLN